MADKFVVLGGSGKTPTRGIAKSSTRKFWDTQAEAEGHAKKIITDRYKETPGQPHITLYVAQIVGVVEVGAPNITTRAVAETDGSTEEESEDSDS